jgi:hypothetical protein
MLAKGTIGGVAVTKRAEMDISGQAKKRPRKKREEARLFGARFRELRETKYRTRAALSADLQKRFGYPVVTPRRLRSIENGADPGFLEITKIAALLQYPLEAFTQQPYATSSTTCPNKRSY